MAFVFFLYRKTLWLEESQNIACKIIIISMFEGSKKAVNIKWFFGYLIPYTWPEVGNRVNDNSLERMTIFHCSGPNINICALWFSDGRPSIKSIPEKLSVNSFRGNRIIQMIVKVCFNFWFCRFLIFPKTCRILSNKFDFLLV